MNTRYFQTCAGSLKCDFTGLLFYKLNFELEPEKIAYSDI